MFFTRAATAAALLFASAYAECPNACSGNGVCSNYAAVFSTYPTQIIELPSKSAIDGTSNINSLGYDPLVVKKDSCTCFTRPGHNGETVFAFTGPDCSLKTCPHASAHSGQPLAGEAAATSAGKLYHTQEIECSGKGLCNSKSGACECFDGYSGDACQRTTCPNNCNNAGKCMTLKQIAEDHHENAVFYGDFVSNTASYTAFDSETSMGCMCDDGRAGPDCSLVECPSTADPMSGEGSESGRDCSGRGLCDYSNGNCICFPGYFGASCETQRNKMI
jgi:hypothetical protein